MIKFVYSHNSSHDCEVVGEFPICDNAFETKKECWEHEIHRLEKEINKLNRRITRDTAYRNLFLEDIEAIKKLLVSK